MLPLTIALAHLAGRTRQTLVSVLGVTLGVGMFIAVSGLMAGFQSTFRAQLIDTNPHILITDEIRRPAAQPLALLHPGAALEIRRILPRDPVRGIAGAGAIVEALSAMPGVAAAPLLRGQLILRRAGRDYAIAVNGIDPARQAKVTTLARDIVAGSLDALATRSDGIIIGESLAEKMGAGLGDTLIAVPPTGRAAALRVVALFRTGQDMVDTTTAYVTLARQQSLQGRPRVVNQIQLRLADMSRSIPFAATIEGRWGYKAAPWEETFARILEVFVLQNVIIYGSTGSILIVAAFGIFNIISTVVMEKGRDIAIMRAIGLPGRVVVAIFVTEGAIVGVLGVLAGCGLGIAIAAILGRIPAPGASDPNQMLVVAQTWLNYGLACGIALASAVVASWLPARRAVRSNPLDTIRGAA